MAYVGNNPEYDVSSGDLSFYYYAGAARVAMRDGEGDLKWLLGDHLGSTSLVVDEDGETVEGEKGYMPWGEQRFLVGEISTTFDFTGQRNEPLIGLHYYGARWYDSELGRFSQADTVIPGSNDVLAWDRYLYVKGNSLRYVDPTGNCSEDPFDPYYDYECFTLAQDISDQYGLPSDLVEIVEYDDLVKLAAILWLIDQGLLAFNEAPLNFSLQSNEHTIYETPAFDLAGGLRLYYAGSIATLKEDAAITIGNEHSDIGSLAIGPATLDYTLMESWVDNVSSALNLGIPNLPIDPWALDLSVDNTYQADQLRFTNTVGIEVRSQTDRLATVVAFASMAVFGEILAPLTASLGQQPSFNLIPR